MDYYKAALELHEQHKGKIEVTAKVPVKDPGRPVRGIYPGRGRALPGDRQGL